MLFVQGSRDAFGTSDEIAALLPSLKRATLHVVPDGDHSFKVRARAAALKPDQVLDSIMDTVIGAGWTRGGNDGDRDPGSAEELDASMRFRGSGSRTTTRIPSG